VFTKNLELPRGRERRPVRERHRIYGIDGAERRALATVCAFRVPEIQAVVEVGDDLTSQSRQSLALAGSPPSAKLLIPLARRDVRVVEGARLESEACERHRAT
jgi:hypothetical protein